MSADSFRLNIQKINALDLFTLSLPLPIHPDTKNNSRRSTCGTGCVWGMPSLPPLSSLACIHIKRDYFKENIMSFSSGKKKLSVINGCSHYAGVPIERYSSQFQEVKLVQTAAIF